LEGKPAGRRFSRTGPGMALCGGPPHQCRITGMPSQSEGPSGGARALWLLSRFSKVTRRQGATLSRRYRDNGCTHPSGRTGFIRERASAHAVNLCRRHERLANKFAPTGGYDPHNACCLDKPGVRSFFASKLHTGSSRFGY
jgi:hypothetical protein